MVSADRALVNRKDTAAKPLRIKLVEDVWTISDCLKHKKVLPRSVLRNGKQDRATFENTRISQSSAHHVPAKRDDKQGPDTQNVTEVSQSNFALTTLMKDMNIIKNELQSLRSCVNSLCTVALSVYISSDLHDEEGHFKLNCLHFRVEVQ